MNKLIQKLKRLGNLTTGYGGETRTEAVHKGVDVANASGTPIPNMAKGIVTAIKTGQVQGSKGYGNSVIIKTKNGDSYRYSHLRDVLVKPGQKVPEGKKIGTMGDSGNTYSPTGGDGSHLDLRILDAYGKYRDPSAKKLRTKK